MTRVEFDEALNAVRNGKLDATDGRIFAACCAVMRYRLAQRHNWPDDYEWGGPTQPELVEFIDNSNKRQLRLLKEIAEGMVMTIDRIH